MPAARTLGAGRGEAGGEDGAAEGVRDGELAGDGVAPDRAGVCEGLADGVAAGNAAGADAPDRGGWADALCGPHAAAASATAANGMTTRTDADRRGMGTSAAGFGPPSAASPLIRIIGLHIRHGKSARGCQAARGGQAAPGRQAAESCRWLVLPRPGSLPTAGGSVGL
jgi:hypothetical protein